MNKKKSNLKFPSELRLDMVSGDWVVIATGRAKRPETFKKEKRRRIRASKKECPFCNIKTQETATLVFSNGQKVSFKNWKDLPEDWTVVSIPNKYPAFFPYPKLDRRKENGLYEKMNAAGFHEVIISKSHTKHIGVLPVPKVREIFDVYKHRYLALKDKKFVNHISIFHNHGPEAGASIAHPHSQIITTPLIDVDLNNALSASKTYKRKEKECIYCRMNDWEMKSKERIVFENEHFLVLCPFASKTAFQVIVSPKKHRAYYENITEEELSSLAEAFQLVMNKLYKGLNNPDYNFYLHTAPCDGGKHDYYHWHWTILPKTQTWAGFEIGTRMEISTIEPEKAAEYLRNL